ncbi:MAG: site-specific DNA-methyltransferase [Planctomycetes bacterium]|nr:site-specific DNA-methyltransferase [Planctomycetota bacterium]
MNRSTTSISVGMQFALGDHRIICGDCRYQKYVLPLFGKDERPKLIITDPPYCSGGFQESKRIKGTWGEIKNDNLSARGYRLLLRDMLIAADVEAAYVFTDWKMWTNLSDAIEETGLAPRSMLVWNKMNPGLGSLWRTQHELICFATNTANKRRTGVPAVGNVLSFKRCRNEFHFTQKPVEVIQAIIRGDSSSPRGNSSIFDPFLGSGSTLLAAEQEGRSCFGCEIEPRFIQATIERWEQLTGKTAQLIRDGRSIH